MKRPPPVRLGGRDWAFRFRRPKSMKDAGLCHFQQALIDVQTGQHPVDTIDTVLHEVMHAIRYCQGREYEGAVEEEWVRSLATGLVSTLKDNPEFASWLLTSLQHESQHHGR